MFARLGAWQGSPEELERWIERAREPRPQHHAAGVGIARSDAERIKRTTRFLLQRSPHSYRSRQMRGEP